MRRQAAFTLREELRKTVKKLRNISDKKDLVQNLRQRSFLIRAEYKNGSIFSKVILCAVII